MESQPVATKKKLKLRVKKISNIYSKNVINVKTLLSMNEIGNNVESLLLSKIRNSYEGKCTKEGFIKHNSVKMINYSSGLVQGNNINFEVVIQCYICKPVEGMVIKNCIVQNNTKAGIKASINEKNSPLFTVKLMESTAMFSLYDFDTSLNSRAYVNATSLYF